ncbi:SDR family NAD(P)-dependent oxidoreductase [Peribacillus acanthi]|uniref:SDR family NAD(P)-dependent oxidoreductase n=1 Tax=Peribacillus acanthi TaxID=2171554 RepID=UPI000D3E96C3|nr:SDR family NAD(P)-dependent oxidoreductase [Peribacillus acanthi]
MKVLVTGGAGFIGHHTVKKLLKESHEVFIIDNLDSYYSENQKLDQLYSIGTHENFTFIRQDLLQEQEVQELFKKIKPDAVIHLAALPGVSYSIENPHAYIEANISMSVNVLKSAGISGCKHVVFASSSSVYGEQMNRPVSEDLANGKVISPYAASKTAAEAFCHAYSHIYGFQLTILRFFTVFGPSGRPDMAIGKFIERLIQGKSITIYGEGQSRDFTYVEDIVNGIYLALIRNGKNEVFNIGAGKPTSMEELIFYLNEIFPSMQVKRESHRVGDVGATWADITKAKTLLGFSPIFTFQEGLKRTVEWAKQKNSL